MAPNTLRPWLGRHTRADSVTTAAISTVFAALHERVLRGDRAASEDFAGQMLPALRGRLRAAFPRADRDTVNDSAEDAILQYLLHPQRFDPSRGVPLDGFLYMVAWRRLANRLREAVARTRMQIAYIRTIADDHRRDEPQDARDGEQADITGRISAAALDARERAALRLWLAGEPVSKLAVALGIATGSAHEQQQEVKRFKDRIRARLRRHVRR